MTLETFLICFFIGVAGYTLFDYLTKESAKERDEKLRISRFRDRLSRGTIKECEGYLPLKRPGAII